MFKMTTAMTIGCYGLTKRVIAKICEMTVFNVLDVCHTLNRDFYSGIVGAAGVTCYCCH